jgi:hypothetical protein
LSPDEGNDLVFPRLKVLVGLAQSWFLGDEERAEVWCCHVNSSISLTFVVDECASSMVGLVDADTSESTKRHSSAEGKGASKLDGKSERLGVPWALVVKLWT